MRFGARSVRLAICVAAAGLCASARAEVSTVTIGETYGLTHLPSYVIVEKHFIEQEAAARGIPSVKVAFKQVSNGNVVADLLLAGQVNVAMSGVIPFIALWDKVRSTLPIKGVASLAQCNLFLMTTDPRIKSVTDYGPNDRIAMTDVVNTTFSLLLEIEAAKLYGWDKRDFFAPLSVPMSNGDATAAMLSGRTEVKSHLTLLPYSTVEYASGHVRPILSSKDVLGSPVTATMAFTTVKFHDQNPKIYAAIAAAFDDAVKFIAQNPEAAAEIYNRHEPQKGGVPSIVKLMVDDKLDELSYTTTPHGMKSFADLMAKAGLIKQAPASWNDLFFENEQGKNGS